jgi:hypothetical protein
MEYYNSNDLLKRRTDIALWVCAQNKKIVNAHKYGELLSAKYDLELKYILATMDAMGCYEPITTEAEDGVVNCLKENELDCIFNNVSIITGLCWQPKGVTYRNAFVQPQEEGQIGTVTTNTGTGVLCIASPRLKK